MRNRGASGFLGTGYLFVLLAAVLWASSGSASKFLFNGGVTPFHLVQLRTTISAIVLFLLLFLRDHRMPRLGKGELASFCLLGATLAAAQFTYFSAISRIQVAAAILLQYQAPVLITVYALLFSRRRPALPTLVALGTAVLGCFLMVGAYSLDILSMNRGGIIAGLASAVAFAAYTLASERKMSTSDPLAVLFYALFFAAIVSNVLQPPLEAFALASGASTWGWILYIALFGTLMAFGFYNEGIRRIRSTHASITATLEPVAAGVISYVFLGEGMAPLQLLGAGMIIGSIILLQANPVQTS